MFESLQKYNNVILYLNIVHIIFKGSIQSNRKVSTLNFT